MKNKNSITFSKKLSILACEIISEAKTSHIGSVLSIRDILSVLFCDYLHFTNKNILTNNRHRLILSKGHAGAGVYSALFLKGFITKKQIMSYCKDDSTLLGHITKNGIPGIDFSTGSLGHGLPVACGIALYLKKINSKNKVYVVMSDGELDEGSNWEAMLFASHHNLNNLIIIIDYNNLQSLDTVKNTLNLEPLDKKISSFGLKVFKINGHSHDKLKNTFNKIDKKKPLCVICKTTKGKGVDFMENKILWHYRSPDKKELKIALGKLRNA